MKVTSRSVATALILLATGLGVFGVSGVQAHAGGCLPPGVLGPCPLPPTPDSAIYNGSGPKNIEGGTSGGSSSTGPAPSGGSGSRPAGRPKATAPKPEARMPDEADHKMK
jgi:hypothetical protein